MRAEVKHTIKLLVMVFAIVAGLRANGQQQALYSIRFADSLQMGKEDRSVSNTIVLKNKKKDTLLLTISVTIPQGWQTVNQSRQLKLLPEEEYILPLTFMPLSNTPAVWMPFELKVQAEKEAGPSVFAFWCRTFPILRLKSYLVSKNEQLWSNKRNIDIKLFLQNTGNISGKYFIRFQNAELGISKKDELILTPGSDTLYTYSFKLMNEQFKALQKEVVTVKLLDTAGVTKVMLFDINKMHTDLKKNPSAYKTLPLEIETGTMLNDRYLTNFGVVKGNINVSKNSLLNFSYKTKELGAYNQIQNDVLSLNLATPKLQLFVGQITDAKNFVAFGNGIKASYKLSEKELYFSGTLHNKNFFYKNDQFEAGIKYPLGKVAIDQSVGANFDGTAGTNSYIVLNKIDVVNKNDLAVSVNGDLGMDAAKRDAIRDKFAIGGGYSFSYKYNNFQFASAWQANSKYFPGINKGLQNQNHSIRWQKNNVTVSTIYQSNRRVFNVFRDSIYNTDFLSFNTRKLGAFAGLKSKYMYMGLGAGKFGQFSTSQSSSLDRYNYLESFYYWQPLKNVKFNASTFIGHSKLEGQNEPVWINSTSASVYVSRFGISGIYTKNPQLTSDSGGKRLRQYAETMNLTPSLNFSVAKRFFFSLSHTVSKTSYDENLTSFSSGSIAYIGKRNGLDVNLYGIVPFSKSNANSPGLSHTYFTFSIRKKIAVPLLFKRKYHSLKVVPFLDGNNNGVKDKGEHTVKRAQVKINSTAFISDRKGEVNYKNIEKGTYTLDFNSVQGIKGFVPAKGFTQKINVEKTSTYQVPFKKSKLIKGSISVVLDSLSAITFTPGGLKVLATDSSGNVFSALADDDGTFLLSLPAGMYTVSLNPEAFDDKIRPEVMAYAVDLTQKEESEVHFIIKQQKRKVRILKN